MPVQIQLELLAAHVSKFTGVAIMPLQRLRLKKVGWNLFSTTYGLATVRMPHLQMNDTLPPIGLAQDCIPLDALALACHVFTPWLSLPLPPSPSLSPPMSFLVSLAPQP